MAFHLRPRRLTGVSALVIALSGVLAANPPPAAAAGYAMCGPGFALPARPIFDIDDTDPEAVHLSAENADLSEGGRSTMSGAVEIQRGTQQLLADEVTYNQPAEVMEALGNVEVWDEGVYLAGDRGRVEFLTDVTEAEEASYMLEDEHAHGDAGHVRITGQDLLAVRDASYSTCIPGQEDWVLTADKVTIDKAKDKGTARNALVRFKKVPIFYSPYLTFPLSDKRKSGFLPPKFRVSDSTGFDFTIPYYFNLHPQFDAKAAVRGMTDRGVQLGGEFRYLTRRGTGRVAGEVLPDDDKFDDDRLAFKLEHEGSFAPRWNTDINYGWVSDEQYFEDLGTNLAVAATSFVEQRGDLTYSGASWSGLLRVQNFQTVDSTVDDEGKPYKRLPQFVARYKHRERNRKVNIGGFGEVVNFDRSSGPTGPRIDLRPWASFPMRTAGWFVTPRASARYTYYDLSEAAPGQTETQPDRFVPTVSVDSGMIFDRDIDVRGQSLRQTLEPRVFYLYTPNVDQDDIPVYDTSELTFSFASLFREDRFSGSDRVGDANQLTLALSTRLLSPGAGGEIARVSVGQLFYFRDREVTLPGQPVFDSGTAPFVAEGQLNIGSRWRALAGIQWAWDRAESDRHTIGIRYKPDNDRVVNLAYRYVRRDSDNIDQIDSSVAWPVGHDWRVVGRFNYSFKNDRILETFGGLEYESCCWAFRTVVRRYLSNVEGDYNNGFFAQLELKGLTGIGRGAVSFLERSIPGYENDF